MDGEGREKAKGLYHGHRVHGGPGSKPDHLLGQMNQSLIGDEKFENECCVLKISLP